MDDQQRLEAISESLSIPRVKHHIIMCADQSNPRCAPSEETNELWRYLKARLKEAGLSSAPPHWQGDMTIEPDEVEAGTGRVLRTKADCLRICEQGAIAVVYPDGTWYAGLNKERIDRIIDEHLSEGRPVEEISFAVGDLS